MKVWKTLPLLALGLMMCVVWAGCGSSSKPPAPAQLKIMTSSLPAGTVNVTYSAPTEAGGGSAPYIWSVASGSLPRGLSLSTSGMISGMPTTAGSSNFTLQVMDSTLPPATATSSLSIAVQGAVSVTTSSLPGGTVGSTYAAALGATGGVTPYKWSVSAGSLPSGLTLTSSGTITGTPASAATSSFTVQVADSESSPATSTKSLNISIHAGLAITTNSLPSGIVGTAYSTNLAATGGVTAYTWSLLTGSLPAGLSLSGAGVISGTPAAAGTADFTVQVSDSESTPQTATAELSITVNQVTITTSSPPAGTTNVAYTATLAAAGGVTPYTWTLLSGGLPVGLNLSATGVISGTPTVTGPSTFTVQVADSEGTPATATAQLTITINSGGQPGKLEGNYAFFLKGSNSTGRWTIAGSFISDGNGNITSGVLDGNSVAGQPYNTTFTGTYSIPSSGLNTMTIQGPSWGPMTLAFVLFASGNGSIIEYDDANGQGSRGSGKLLKQDPTAFSRSNISGGFTFGMTGAGASGERVVEVGVFAIDHGILALGACMINDGGDFSICAFTGLMSAVDPQTGRATTQILSTSGPGNQAVYVVTSSELLLEQIDWVTDTGNPMLLGWAQQQIGPFTNASLNGPVVLYYQGIHGGDGTDQSGAMIVNFDGNGNLTLVASDDDSGGNFTQGAPAPGTLSVHPMERSHSAWMPRKISRKKSRAKPREALRRDT